jgi:hypothetical protein
MRARFLDADDIQTPKASSIPAGSNSSGPKSQVFDARSRLPSNALLCQKAVDRSGRPPLASRGVAQG